MTGNIKFDDFSIQYSSMQHTLDEPIDLLNKLHERGFYRRVHVYITINTQEHIDKLARVKGLVRISEMIGYVKLTYLGLKNIEELDLCSSKNVIEINLFPNNLVSLKRISFSEASFVDIMPFICRSVEMQEIKIYELISSKTRRVYFSEDTNAIDLFALIMNARNC